MVAMVTVTDGVACLKIPLGIYMYSISFREQKSSPFFSSNIKIRNHQPTQQANLKNPAQPNTILFPFFPYARFHIRIMVDDENVIRSQDYYLKIFPADTPTYTYIYMYIILFDFFSRHTANI